MLAAILFLALFAFVCLPYGWGAVRGLQRVLGAQEDLPNALWLILIGCMAVTWIASLLSIFVPMRGPAFAAAAAGAIALIVAAWRSDRPALLRAISFERLQIPEIVLLALLVFTVLYLGSLPSTNSDTSLYHAQAIHWIEDYRAVPGLGNLNGRLAFNSNWLVANAFFSLVFLRIQSFHLLPTAFFLLVNLHFFGGLRGWIRGRATPANILKTLFIPVGLYSLAAELPSPGTDLPATLLVWLTAALWLDEDESPAGPTRTALLILIPCFALTIKLSAAPLLLVSAIGVGWWLRQRRFAPALSVSLIAVVGVIPWMIRNAILSGYLIYPQTAVDPFGVDWKVPLERVAQEQVGILGFARIPGVPAAIAAAMPFGEWLPIWFARLGTFQLVIFALSTLAPLVLAAAWLFFGRTGFRREWALVAAAYAGMIFWLVTAPDVRFGYGLLGILALTPAAALGARLLPSATRARWAGLLALACLTGYLGYTLVRRFDPAMLAADAVLPAAYSNEPTDVCRIANTALYAARSDRLCGYSAFPCAPVCRPELELRGPGWGDGFRVP